MSEDEEIFGGRTMPVKSTAHGHPLQSATDGGFSSSVAEHRFCSEAPTEKRFKVENLFAFKRGRGDLVFSFVMLGLVLFLLWHFTGESGWDQRKLPQKRVGKILKQPWVGPFLCMTILVPAVVFNLWQSYRKRRRDVRQRIPNRIKYELEMWVRSFEFIAYFLIYTFVIGYIGYLFATLLFAVCLTYRLGYRSRRWIAVSASSAFAIVLLFRTILQIKTPVNIWLYNQLPVSIESFMKVYF